MTGRAPSQDRGPLACSVWWATPTDRAEFLRLLPSDERARAARMRPERRAHFVTGRAIARTVLADRAARRPADVRITTVCSLCGAHDHGRPAVDEPAAPASLSLTYARDRVGVAVTPGPPVGIDVALAVDAADPERTALSRAALTLAELGTYRALEPSARGIAMAVWWTRKEAVLKATGDGLTVAPDRVHVSDPSRPAALLGWDHPTGPGPAPGPGAAPPPLALHDLAPGPGYVACLAVFSTRPVEVQEADGDALLAAVRTPGTCR